MLAFGFEFLPSPPGLAKINFLLNDFSHIYTDIIKRVVSHEEILAVAADEVVDDTECIFTLEMLQGVAAENQIKLFVNVINNNVMNLVGIDIHIMVYKLRMITSNFQFLSLNLLL